jgi:repressor LexA
MTDLTPIQRRIFDFLLSFQKEHGRTPTGPEITDEFGYGDHSTVYQHLRAIARKGYLDVVQAGRRKPLRIMLTEKAARLLRRGWPLFGSIPAGPLSAVLAEDVEMIEGVEDLFPMIREDDYFLTVEGDSMIDAGLEEGMTVLMRPVSATGGAGYPIKPGTICAVWVEGEGGTLKRVYGEGEMVRLVPENDKYSPRSYAADQVRIQGVVVAALTVKTPH